MIDRRALLRDLQKVLTRLEADLLERSESPEVPDVGKSLRAIYERAKTAARTAQSYEEWLADYGTQMAAAWVLSCVFMRFLEDNRLIDPPKMAGPDDRLKRAKDEYEHYFRQHPRETDREYLISLFDQLAGLTGARDIFGDHNPTRELPNWLSPDAAGELLRFFRRVDANTGALVHDFTDPDWDTRFLGDLYQDLSEAARKKYALLQTPEFVEEFILDRTLNPALDEFGLAAVPVLDKDGKPLTEAGFRMIDPACGSGHFLLGAFPRILARWQRKEPGTNVRELVQRTLNSIHGVDVNPYAVAIARFRLVLAAMRACNVTRLADAPGFRMNLACGDSLLHAPLRSGQQVFDFELSSSDTECEHAYQSEDLPLLKRILRRGQFHTVVANPPYVQPSDGRLSVRYRNRFSACHGLYSLSVPFTQQILGLALQHGFTGQITGNSFMTCAFGRRFVEEFLSGYDITTIVDSSKAHVPGHGTGHALLFIRRQPSVASHIRVVLGKRGEPQIPSDPSRGRVWMSIVNNIDISGHEDDYVTVADAPRSVFARHPWVLSGGGAAELQRAMSEDSEHTLQDFVHGSGFFQDTHADEAFVHDSTFARRMNCNSSFLDHLRGEELRDWRIDVKERVLFPYDDGILPWTDIPRHPTWLWLHRLRTYLWNRTEFSGGTYKDAGKPWFVFHQIPPSRAKRQTRIAFSATATHNHFVIINSPVALNRSAPVVDLDHECNDPSPRDLLCALNCSVVGFWLRQNSQPKAGGGIGRGLTPFPYEQRRQFSCETVLKTPMPSGFPTALSQSICAAIERLCHAEAGACLRRALRDSTDSLALVMEAGKSIWESALGRLIAYQEELDWECYSLYGLIDEKLTVAEPSPLRLGQRAFEIELARKMASGKTTTTWFERHGSTPITELPAEWPADYRRLVERRIALIESDANIRLIEQPEYKRRWNTEPWESQLERALREWLLNRLEGYFDFDGRMQEITQSHKDAKQGRSADHFCAFAPLREISICSITKLADIARQDADFTQVGELYRDDPAFDVQALVVELVTAESVPLLPILRYKPTGLRKRAEWEKTWELQRLEDRLAEGETGLELRAWNLEERQIGAIQRLLATPQPLSSKSLALSSLLSIPVPPKYDSKDFLDSNCWRLRGKLDVPKERWISFPHCEGPDGTLAICWAGYDHLQQAKAISAYYVDIQERLGGREDPRLIPLLACLAELLPWLKQWHNEPDSGFGGMRMGDYFEDFIADEARQHGKTIPEIKAWMPPAKTGRRRSS